MEHGTGARRWLAHRALILVIAVAVTIAAVIGWTIVAQEYPYRLHLGVALILAYGAWRLVRGGNVTWWSYGVIFVLWPLKEVERFAMTLEPNFAAYGVLFLWIGAHAVAGVTLCEWRKRARNG